MRKRELAKILAKLDEELKTKKEIFTPKLKTILPIKQEKTNNITTNLQAYEIDKDTTLNLENISNLQLHITKSCTLTLKVISKNFSAHNITIIIKEDVHLELIEQLDSISTYIFLNLELEKQAKLTRICATFAVALHTSKAILEEDARYDLHQAYHVSNNNTFINNIAHHKGKNSFSQLNISGSAQTGANVTNDGFIRIENKATKSTGTQYMKNILLDTTAKIASEPVLEILNNDVICSHGSSISQIDEKTYTYLAARGIEKQDAIHLIITGFFEELSSYSSNKEAFLNFVEQRKIL